MNREVLDQWCERGILALVLAILVFGPLALGAVRPLEFGIIEGLTAGVLLLWTARLWLTRRPQLLWAPICWAVVAFTLYAIGRYFTADIEYVARHEVFRVLVYAFLFLAILNNLHRQESMQVLCYSMIFLAMAISGYAVFQFFTDSGHVWHFATIYRHRGSGTYYNPNHLGGFLEMLLPLGLAYALAGRAKHVTRIFLGYASLVILAGIAVTVSRGAWAATVVALAGFFAAMLFRRNYRLPALALLVVVVAATAYYLPRNLVFQRRLRQVVTNEGKLNDDLRFSLWNPAWQMWKENPWWGVGPAHFNARFRAYRPEGVQLTPERVHNDYLNTLTDWGVAGTALVASAWALLAWGVGRTWSSVRLSSGDLGRKVGSNKFALVLGGSLGLVAILVHSAVDFNFHVPANAILAVTLMALVSSHLRFASDRFWVRANVVVKCIGSLCLVAGAVYLVAQGWRQAAEFVWLDRAARASAYSPRQIQLLERAEKLDPMNPQTAWQLGEAYRRESQEGGEVYPEQPGMDYRRLALLAMDWFGRGMKLNPWDSRNWAGYGWCLDQLDRQTESRPYFSRAEALDPNNYFNLNNIGMHYVQTGDFAAARPWFERSLRLKWEDNPIARNYLEIVNSRMLEAATNDLSARLLAPAPH